jgi:hypothetical protein
MSSYHCMTGRIIVTLSFTLAHGILLAGVEQLAAPVGSYLETHCLRCHDEDVQKGDFRLDTLSTEVGKKDTPQWLEVMSRISSGEMPPKKEKQQPSATQSAAVVEWISDRMKEGEAARMAARARVTFNRLTREEYVHTVEDLLGVHYDATDPGGFLEEAEWHGFERIGSVLSLSPSALEKYLAAAETILSEAYPASPVKAIDSTKPAILETQLDLPHRERLSALGMLDKVRFEMWPGDIFRYSAPRDPLPEAGVYEITYKLSGLQPPQGIAPRLYVYESKLDRVLHEQDVIAAEDQPTTITFRTHLPKGRPSIDVINNVPGPSISPRSGRHGRVPFISTKEGRIPWQMKLTDEAGQARSPFLILDAITFRGPMVSEQEHALRAAYLPVKEGDMAEVAQRLSLLASRAFRRPLLPGEVDEYVAIVKAELSSGEKFLEAVKAGMAAILCSKSFLFLTEGEEATMRHTLNDWELASRLSYFLWSTQPDSILLQLAEQGTLHEPAVLQAQAQRLLADARAARFSESFSTQWLQLKKVGRFAPDKMLYPDYDKHLEKSMIGETRAFFHQVLQSGLSLREFLHSDWTMLNARLASYYGLPAAGLPGDSYQRVSLPAGSHRGGLLTHAAILSLTSDGTRHRPVHRGAWLSEVIFGKTPPPPPANVEPIAPNPVDSPKATLRMKLDAHKHDPNCASCHAKIDPLGLAFENYDAIGRWRTEEVVAEGTGKNPSVDASGTLPDGRSYKDAEQFKQLLLHDMDAFHATFIEKLATYALRRSMSFDDREELQAIATEGKAKDYRVKDIVQALVTSELFRQR